MFRNQPQNFISLFYCKTQKRHSHKLVTFESGQSILRKPTTQAKQNLLTPWRCHQDPPCFLQSLEWCIILYKFHCVSMALAMSKSSPRNASRAIYKRRVLRQRARAILNQDFRAYIHYVSKITDRSVAVRYIFMKKKS
eukprot:gb/GEZJ01005371.1/.p1 GENE.gb/GEZJ01005371.1/~~gb/GEZJ01005371.1/.p1  ORF type:complete len:138 (+),score=4.52 gb/GEZJ01005371.1/:715-1128(+)